MSTNPGNHRSVDPSTSRCWLNACVSISRRYERLWRGEESFLTLSLWASSSAVLFRNSQQTSSSELVPSHRQRPPLVVVERMTPIT
jgi:hypothetical protein